jgi:tyrosinase
MLNFPAKGCLKRDFVPWILNTFADPALVQNVLAQKDYTGFARAIENIPSFDEPNIHGSTHFGVGGVLGTIGNPENSPGDPLFYLHHGNLDRVLWVWQQKDLMDFTVNMGRLARNATLKELLDTQGGTLCYTY